MRESKKRAVNKFVFWLAAAGAAAALCGCAATADSGSSAADGAKAADAKGEETAPVNVDWEESDKETLRYAFEQDFGGTAGVCLPAAAFSNSARMEIVTSQYNSVTMENEMKPESLLGEEPNIGEDGFPVLDFSTADDMLRKIAEYNAGCQKEEKKLKIRGHVLVWHSQTPEWFFHEDYDENKPYADKDTMLSRMEHYIAGVMEHFDGEGSEFAGMIYAWDVVNEAVNDTDGGLRTDSSWFKVFYDEKFVEQAFVYANKYAPAHVKLFYNDYNDTNEKKADGICKLIEKIKENPEARIDGMGMQGHYDMNTSASDFEKCAEKYAALVDEIQITELDMKSSSDYDGSDPDAEYLKQAYQYKSIYDAVVRLKEEKGVPFTNITFWGTDDGNSWLQSSNSVGGSADGSRPMCPLPFDAAFQAKPAFWAFVDASVLEPYVKELPIAWGEDFDSVQPTAIEGGEAKISFVPIWNENGIGVKVSVIDATKDETDAVSVYIDPADSRQDGAKTLCTTVSRNDAEETARGYDAEIYTEMTELTPFSAVGFDISVTDGDSRISWNDTNGEQSLGSSHYGRLILKPFASIGKGTVKIDGVEDENWKDAPELMLTVTTAEGGTPEAQGRARALWDEEALYVWMEVTDPNLDVSGSEVHTKDSVEVFVDETNNKADSYGTGHKQYRINCENEHSFNGPNCKEDYITSAVTKTADGYIVEVSVAWTELEPAAGKNIGFELQINDCKQGSRLGMINWYDTTNTCWSSPASYGTARLAE